MRVLLVCLLTAACLHSAGVVSAQTARAEAPEPFQLPFLIDAGYRARIVGGGTWHGPEALLQLRLDKAFRNDSLTQQTLSFGGFWETGAGFDPNPTRFCLVAGYGFGSDFFTGGGDLDYGLTRDGAFPLTRYRMFNAYTQFMAGYITSRGTRENGPYDSQDALRLEARGAFGLVAVEFQNRLALNFNLRDGRFIDAELYFGIELARPMLPFGLRVGYSYVWIDRAGGSGLEFALRVAF